MWRNPQNTWLVLMFCDDVYNLPEEISAEYRCKGNRYASYTGIALSSMNSPHISEGLLLKEVFTVHLSKKDLHFKRYSYSIKALVPLISSIPLRANVWTASVFCFFFSLTVTNYIEKLCFIFQREICISCT